MCSNLQTVPVLVSISLFALASASCAVLHQRWIMFPFLLPFSSSSILCTKIQFDGPPEGTVKVPVAQATLLLLLLLLLNGSGH